ncbi:hypothetical protein RHMOL_Rhmol03G0290800 [Rhododendron molle]|uniref:Uncharacterized protein n=1 Tax=Rhododendron molle TaxID=49168 RepID=A0ACC0PLB5_RHOML|nr:hypothetical protein RHMOL_Rhmol03G0290800 [Rhododendron molle]
MWLQVVSASPNMANGPAPFSDIGKQAKDLLTKDYNFDHKFTFLVPSPTGLGLTATGVKKDQIFIGDICTQYKNGNTTVDVKVDTYSKVSTKVTVNEIFSSTKAALSFDVPDHKSGKLDVQYLHNHAAINSSIGLNPAPLLEVAATLGDKNLVLGGEIGFDTASASFTRYNAGIGFNKADFSAALILITVQIYSFVYEYKVCTHAKRIYLYEKGSACGKYTLVVRMVSDVMFKSFACSLSAKVCSNVISRRSFKQIMDKGKALKASYIHSVNPLNGIVVAAEMTHRFSSYENSFTIGSSHAIDPYTRVKTRFSNNGKVAMLCQSEWRPKSLITVSAEYDTKAINASPKLGLALALKP